MNKITTFLMFSAILAAHCVCAQTAGAQGLELFGVGPVNRSMGGAATAAPIEAIGALFRNPATVTGLDSSQLSIGVETVLADSYVNSRVAGIAGSSRSDGGWNPIPSVGFVSKMDNLPFTIGLGVFGIAGYGVNYSASTTNPIAFPQTPTGVTPLPGLGRIFSNVSLLQITPTIAMQVTDRLSIGVQPTATMAQLSANPFPLVKPDDANMDGVSTYPASVGTRYHWGGGFRIGAYYQTDADINLGASFTSKQWFEPIRYVSTNEIGLPRNFSIGMEYPTTVSLGASYTGLERFLFAVDVRWLDWAHAQLWGDPARFDASGRLTGLGWKSTWAVGLGTQYQLNDLIALRLGYTASQSPITSSVAGFNVLSPLILKHAVNAGATMSLSEAVKMHFVYYYGVEASVAGPLQSAAGPVPNSAVQLQVSAHAVAAGLTVAF